MADTMSKNMLVGPSFQNNILEHIDELCMAAIHSKATQAEHGQFFTPRHIAQFMARLITERTGNIRILDAGAGVGSLSAALVMEMVQWIPKPSAISLTAYEIDPILTEYLYKTLRCCQELCDHEGVCFEFEVIQDDFIRSSVESLSGHMFAEADRTFDVALLNPPYRKIPTNSATYRLIRKIGIETSNLYSAFLWLTIKLLKLDGELVAITPRSFCNGPYFLPFRRALLETMSIRRIHVFESRNTIFAADDVLQENIIFHAIKTPERKNVLVSSSIDGDDPCIAIREIDYNQFVYPDDPNRFIHIVPDVLRQRIGQLVRDLCTSIDEIGIQVSTGKVVDFRAKEFLVTQPDRHTVPLIYPGNLANGYVQWPKHHQKKPSAIRFGSRNCPSSPPFRLVCAGEAFFSERRKKANCGSRV